MNNEAFTSTEEAIDFGKDYEYLISALFALILSLNDEVTDFKISSNNQDFGDFDDVIIELKLDNGEEHTLALQLKHISRPIAQIVLITDNKKFGLKKYGKEFKKLKIKYTQRPFVSTAFENIHFILYTNSTLEKFEEIDEHEKRLEPTANGKRVQSDLMICKFEHPLGRRLNLWDGDNNFIYKFKPEAECSTDEEFFQQFYFYTQQKSVKEVERLIAKTILTTFPETDPNVAINYMNFFSYWCRRDFGSLKLTKRDVKLKLAELILTQHVPEPDLRNLGYPSEEAKDLLFDIVKNFDMIVLRQSSEKVMRILWGALLKEFQEIDKEWTEPIQNVYQDEFFQGKIEVPVCAKSENFNEVTLKRLYLTLWHCNIVPLIIKGSNETILKALKLTEGDNKTFIILGEDNFQGLKVFRTLKDLTSLEATYQKTIGQLWLSLQGRSKILLKEFLQSDDALLETISFREILLMLSNNFILGGNQMEDLPKHYVNRFLPKILLKINVLLEINDVFIVSCKGSSLEILKKYLVANGVNMLVNIEKYILLKESRSTKVPKQLFSTFHLKQNVPVDKFIIYVNDNDHGEDQIKEIFSMNSSKHCHHVRLIDEHKIEWIYSEEGIHNLLGYRLNCYNEDYVEDVEVFTHFQNKVNVICAEPGMGKTVMTEILKNQCPSRFWVIKINLNQHVHFFKKEPNADEAVEYFLKIESENEFIKKVVTMFHRQKKLVFIWDSFDEMSQECTRLITGIIKKLCYPQWIFSRSNLRNHLENVFGLFALTMTKFTRLDQYNYIFKHLSEEYGPEDLEKIIEIIRKSLIGGYSNYSGIPLQVHMMVEICKKNPQARIVALTDVYHEFIGSKFDHMFKEAEADLDDYNVQEMKEQFKDNLLPQYEIIALEATFGDRIVTELNLNCEELLTELEANEDLLGLIARIGDDRKPIFVHKTYGEYLSALWLSKNYQNYQELMMILFREEYSNVRFMFDMIITRDSPVLIAVLYKNISMLEKCRGEIEDCKDSMGRNALQLACSWGRRHPLIKSIDDTIGDNTEKILLLGESINGVEEEDTNFLEMLVFLTEQNCEFFDYNNFFKWNVFQYADQTLSLAAVNLLLNHHQVLVESLRNYSHIPSLLTYATIFSYQNVIKIIDDVPYIEYFFDEGTRSLLQLAVEENNIALVEKLLSFERYQKVINQENPLGSTPLNSAAYNSNVDMINLLLNNGAGVNGFKSSAVAVAALTGNQICCKKLIDAGAEVNGSCNNNMPALVAAIVVNNIDIIKLLLENGAEVNCEHEELEALSCAVLKNSYPAVQLLLEYNSDVNHRCDKLGYTALHYSTGIENLDILRSLLEHGADTKIKSNDKLSPLHLAIINENKEAATELINADPSVINDYSFDEEYLTPLNFAVQENFSEILELMVAHGADIDGTETGLPPLCVASGNGGDSCVIALIKAGASINHVGADGVTPLVTSVSHLSTLKILLDNSADMNYRNRGGLTALHHAVFHGKLDVVEELVRRGADLTIKSDKGKIPLYCAIEFKHNTIANFLIRNSSKIEDSEEIFCLAARFDLPDCVSLLLDCGVEVNARDSQQKTALHYAATRSKEIVQMLLESKADPNAYGKFGRILDVTPLMSSILFSRPDIIKQLLSAGAKTRNIFGSMSALHVSVIFYDIFCTTLLADEEAVNAVDHNGKTPLHYVAENGIGLVYIMHEVSNDPFFLEYFTSMHQDSKINFNNVDCSKELILRGADVNRKDFNLETPLHLACSQKHLKLVEILIGHGADLNAVNNKNQTPLHKSFEVGASRIANLLITRGAQIDVVDEFGKTPMDYAAESICKHNSYDGLLLRKLHEFGADLELADENGLTLLHKAAKAGNTEIVSCLLKNGTDVNRQCSEGRTPIFYAVEHNRKEVVNMLLQCPTNINMQDNRGDALLHVAASSGHRDIIEPLLEAGCSVDTQNSSGSTALHLSVQFGFVDACEILLEAGASISLSNGKGMTPLTIATSSGNPEIIELFGGKKSSGEE